MEQFPAATVAVHVSPRPSLTVTLPVNAPSPDVAGVTLNANVTDCPVTDGLGVADVMTVVVFVRLTVCVTLEVLGLKLSSPAYDAVSVLVPDAANVIEQFPLATVAVHVPPAPSLTVTLPVGVPTPDVAGVTVKLIVTAWRTNEGFGECDTIAVVVLSGWLGGHTVESFNFRSEDNRHTVPLFSWGTLASGTT
jgi:hypothetical protein